MTHVTKEDASKNVVTEYPIPELPEGFYFQIDPMGWPYDGDVVRLSVRLRRTFLPDVTYFDGVSVQTRGSIYSGMKTLKYRLDKHLESASLWGKYPPKKL